MSPAPLPAHPLQARLHGLLRDFLRGERRADAQAMVETALSLVVTITLAFWLFELSMMSYTCIVLNDAAHEGVRYATLHGTDSTLCSGPDPACSDHAPYNNVQATVRGITGYSLHDTSAMTVTVTYPDANAKPGSRVAVVVAYTYVPYINFPGLQTPMTFTTLGRITY
ncbi:MAG TPA: TadE/TadG family type IV pilus assembly protein [Acidisarcina sp.]